MSARPDRVILVGQDAPLWLAASVLRAGLGPSGVTVEAVELPSRIGPADVIATQPAIEALHHQLRIDEAQLLRATRASFTLGQRFTGPGGGFFHAHGSAGAPIDGGNFLPVWLKGRAHGLPAALTDFSLTAAAALQGRMLLPDEETERFGRTDYGYHLPAAAYARALRRLAVKDGVVVHPAAVVEPVLGEVGIAALQLDGGRRVEGGFFIDLTADGRLMDALEVGFDSWREQFPTTHVLRARGPGFRSVPAFADVRATEHGSVALYPSQAETRVVFAYADLDLDAALAEASAAAGLPLADVRIEVFEPGRRSLAWQANCVAIGAAAARFDPVHDMDLHTVQLGLVHVLPLFPVSGAWAPERAEYNRLIAALFDRARDFQAAHYALARWPGAFWDRARRGARSPELAHKIATFAARGELSLLEDEVFPLDSWNALFVGHGLRPESWTPSADRTEPETMRAEFRRMLGFVKDKVLAQPTHDAYLAEHGGRRAA